MAVAFETKHLPRLLPKPEPLKDQPKKRPKLSIQPIIFESVSQPLSQPEEELQEVDEHIQHQISYSEPLEAPSVNNLIDLMQKIQKERDYINENKIDPFFQMLSNEMSKKTSEDQRLLKIKLFNIVFGTTDCN